MRVTPTIFVLKKDEKNLHGENATYKRHSSMVGNQLIGISREAENATVLHTQAHEIGRNRGELRPAEAHVSCFRANRGKKKASGSFPLCFGLSWKTHLNATIFLTKLSSRRIYLFVRRPVTSFLVSFWLKSSNVDYDGFRLDGIAVQNFGCVDRETEDYIPINRKS